MQRLKQAFAAIMSAAIGVITLGAGAPVIAEGTTHTVSTYVIDAGGDNSEAGKITASNSDIADGSNHTVEYFLAEPYLINNIVVDEEDINAADHRSSYTFENVTTDHSVRVYAIEAKAPVLTTVITDSNGKEKDGSSLAAGDIIKVSINIENPSKTAQEASLSTHVPSGTKVSDKIGVEGALPYATSSMDMDGNTSSAFGWKYTIPANSTQTFQYTLNVTKDNISIDSKVQFCIGGWYLYSNNLELGKSSWTPSVPTISVADAESNDINNGWVSEGDTLTYKIEWKNTSSKDVVAKLTDTLPTELTVSGAESDAVVTDNTVTLVRTIKAGESLTAKINAKVNAGQKAAVIKNSASIEVNGTSVSSDSTTSYIPYISVSMQNESDQNADDYIINTDGSVTYTIHVENPSNKSESCTIKDTFPSGMSFVSASDDKSYTTDDTGITWNHTLGAGEKKDFTVTLRAAKENTAYDNAASLTIGGKSYPPRTGAPTVYVPSNAIAELSVIGTDGNDIANKTFIKGADVNFVYKITVRNPSGISKTFNISDKLPSSLTLVKTSDNGVLDKSTNTIGWEVSLEGSEEKTVTAEVSVSDNANLTAITNSANIAVDGYKGATGETAVYFTDKATINAFSKKEIKADAKGKGINSGLVFVGDTFAYDITWTNPTKETQSYTVTDTLPDGLTFVEASDKGTETDGVVKWSNISMEAGASKTVTLIVSVDKKTEDTKINNSAKITYSNNTKLFSDETGNAMVYVGKVEETARNAANGDNIYNDLVSDGEHFWYDIFVNNKTGKDQIVTIKDTIDSRLTIVTVSGDVEKADQTVTWTDATVPDEGAHFYIEVSVKSKAQTAGKDAQILNTAAVTTAETKGTATTNKAVVYVMPNPAMSAKIISNDGSYANTDSGDSLVANKGSEITYTIHQENTSQDAREFIISNTVNEHFEIKNINSNGKLKDRTITWAVLIPAGGSADASFSVTVPDPEVDLCVENTAVSTTCKNASATSNTVAVTIKKSASSASARDNASTGPTITETSGIAASASAASEAAVSAIKNFGTGDSSNIPLYAGIGVAAIAGIAVVIIAKKRKNSAK